MREVELYRIYNNEIMEARIIDIRTRGKKGHNKEQHCQLSYWD
jgi:hypothetical protein